MNIFKLIIFILFIGQVAAPCNAIAQTPKKVVSKDLKIQLEKQAAKSLWHLKNALKKDGFYSCRIALNVWRETALEAGVFDKKLYQEFFLSIYQKSIDHNLKWFELFVTQGEVREAETCLNMWRIHTQVIDSFDEDLYKEMKNKLKSIRKRKK